MKKKVSTAPFWVTVCLAVAALLLSNAPEKAFMYNNQSMCKQGLTTTLSDNGKYLVCR